MASFQLLKRAGHHQKGAALRALQNRALQKRPRQNTVYWHIKYKYNTQSTTIHSIILML